MFANDVALWAAAALDAALFAVVCTDALPNLEASGQDAAVWQASANDAALFEVLASDTSESGVPMGTYQIDTTIEITGTFVSLTTGQPADPGTITLLLQDPLGDQQTLLYPADGIVRTGVGVYTYSFTPSIWDMDLQVARHRRRGGDVPQTRPSSSKVRR